MLLLSWPITWSLLLLPPRCMPRSQRWEDAGGLKRILPTAKSSDSITTRCAVSSGGTGYITLVMLALAFLVSIAAAAQTPLQELAFSGEPSADQPSADLWPLSVPEARHLLARLLFPAPSSVRLCDRVVSLAPLASATGEFLPYPPSAEGGLTCSLSSLNSLGIPAECKREFPGSAGNFFSSVLFSMLFHVARRLSKGELIMTLVPFADCCLWLGVDPKTFRLWLKAANLSCCLHPTDARLKCLTPSQLQHLADLHGRCLPHPLPGTDEDVASCSSAPALMFGPSAAGLEALMPPPDADLRHQVTRLQAQVTALSQQVAELALALLRERDARGPERTSQLKTPLSSLMAQLLICASSRRCCSCFSSPWCSSFGGARRARSCSFSRTRAHRILG